MIAHLDRDGERPGGEDGGLAALAGCPVHPRACSRGPSFAPRAQAGGLELVEPRAAFVAVRVCSASGPANSTSRSWIASSSEVRGRPAPASTSPRRPRDDRRLRGPPPGPTSDRGGPTSSADRKPARSSGSSSTMTTPTLTCIPSRRCIASRRSTSVTPGERRHSTTGSGRQGCVTIVPHSTISAVIFIGDPSLACRHRSVPGSTTSPGSRRVGSRSA